MAIVTVSRQFGSGGSEVAERVAAALGWKLYDNAVVDAVAARLNMTTAEVSAREERLPSLAERVASALSLGAPEATLAGVAITPSEERLVEMTSLVMQEAVQAGPAVLVGRGAQCMLATRADALHVYCYAPAEALVEYAVAHLGIAREDAPRRVAEMNRQREDYVKRHWKREWRDLGNYDLCVNTARLGVERSAALVATLARERFG